MSNDEFVHKIASQLAAFATDPANAALIARARTMDWSKASLEEREAVRREFMATPGMQQVAATAVDFGYPTAGIGGMLSASIVGGAGGGGGVMTHKESNETKGVGFAFGSLGFSASVSADFCFLCYRSKPSEFYGLFHGAYAKIHVVGGVGAYTAHCGAGWDSRWEAFIFAVGAGVGGGAGGFVGGAWNG